MRIPGRLRQPRIRVYKGQGSGSLRESRREKDGHRTPSAVCKKGRAWRVCSVHDGADVVAPLLEGKGARQRDGIGEPAATLIEKDQACKGRKPS